MDNKTKDSKEKKKPAEAEDEIGKLVEIWINQNPAQFTVKGIFGKTHLLYRKNVLQRYKQYKDAPDEYLTTTLKTFPEAFKWYFDIFQAVFMAGIVGLVVTACVFAWSSFVKSISNWIFWVLPALFVIIVFILAFTTNKKTESSWLSYIIQHWFKITHNLNELKIEMYYISTILEKRKQNDV